MQLSSAQKCGDSGVTRLENSPTICIPPSFIDSPSSSSSSLLSLSLSSSYQGIWYWLFAQGCTGMLAHEKQALPRPAEIYKTRGAQRKIFHLANFYPFPAEKCSAQHIPDLNSFFKPPFPCAFIHIAGIHWNWCLHCTKDSCSCDAHCAVQLLQLFQVCNRFYLWFSFFFLKTAEVDPTDFG